MIENKMKMDTITELSVVECNAVFGAISCTCYYAVGMRDMNRYGVDIVFKDSDDEVSQMKACKNGCCTKVAALLLETASAVYVGKSASVRMPCANDNVYPLTKCLTYHDLSMFAS